MHQLKKENPDKEFILVHPKVICGSMKKVTLKRLYEALLHEQYRVEIDPEITKKAQLSINRMLEIDKY